MQRSKNGVLLIAHRGNLVGPDPSLENRPDRIELCLQLNFNVEVDVWYSSNKKQFYLGHDRPDYEVCQDFLLNNSLWLHAKNLRALEVLLSMKVNCFWHERDDYTLTSFGYIWTYNGLTTVGSNSIYVSIDKPITIPKCYGICSDYVGDLVK